MDQNQKEHNAAPALHSRRTTT